MKITLIGLATAFVCSATGLAGELPIIFEKPFLGCFVGFSESRDFEFAIGADGSSELFFRKGKKERLTTGGTTLNIYYVLEEKQKGKQKWTNRMMTEDGFETSFKETVTPERGKPISFTATYTGDTKVEVTHVFSKDGVEISTRILGKKTENELRVGVKVVIGDMYRHIKEKLTERELKSKIKKSRMQVWPVDSKRSSGKKIDLYEIDIKMQEEFPKGATKFAMESDRLADHGYTISTADPKLGIIEFKQTKDLYHGFSLYWWPDPAKSKEKGSRMVIEVD